MALIVAQPHISPQTVNVYAAGKQNILNIDLDLELSCTIS